MLFLSIAVTYPLFNKPDPPVKITNRLLTSDTVPEGQPLQYTFTIERNRSCPATIQKFFRNENTIYRLPEEGGGASPLGTFVTQAYVSTHGTLANGERYRLSPGKWCFVAVNLHYCEYGLYSIPLADLCFLIVD